MDEHRIGLKPILRRIWAPKGATVVAPVAQRYQWMYVYAFVHPESGRSSWFLLPSVNAEVFSQVLELFAQEVGVQPLLVVDNSAFPPIRLTTRETRRILASREVRPAPHFKQRGFVWCFM